MFADPTLSEPPRRLIGVSTLSRFFSAGASLAARSLKYVRLSEAILDEQLGPERIAAIFKLSACKTAKADCAFVLWPQRRKISISTLGLVGRAGGSDLPRTGRR